MPDEVRCPGCGCARSYHGPDGCLAPLKRDCTLTPAEIDAVLAMRSPKPSPSCKNCGDTGWVSTDAPGRAGPLTNVCPRMCAAGQREFAAVLQNQRISPSSTPLVSCEGCGIVRVPRGIRTCPLCGVEGRQPVVT